MDHTTVSDISDAMRWRTMLAIVVSTVAALATGAISSSRANDGLGPFDISAPRCRFESAAMSPVLESSGI